MTAQEIVHDLILYEQSGVVELLLKTDESLIDRIDNLSDDDEVLEWWLVTPFMAELLKEENEVILAEHDCYWWGRQCSGQAIYMDAVMTDIAASFD